MINLQAHT